MKPPNPLDIDSSRPFVETPFYKWMSERNPAGIEYFVDTLFAYLDIEKGKDFLKPDQLECYRWIHYFFWEDYLNDKQTEGAKENGKRGVYFSVG